MSRGKEKQKIIIGMRKGSDFLKKSGIISMTTEYRLGNCCALVNDVRPNL